MAPLMSGLWFSWRIERLIVTVPRAAVFLQNLTAQVDESLIDINAASSRGFVIRLGTPLLSQLESSGSGNDAVLLHVALIADDYYGDVVVVLDSDDLFSKVRELVEGVHIGDREDKQETVSLLHVELAHGRELVCASCIESTEV